MFLHSAFLDVMHLARTRIKIERFFFFFFCYVVLVWYKNVHIMIAIWRNYLTSLTEYLLLCFVNWFITKHNCSGLRKSISISKELLKIWVVLTKLWFCVLLWLLRISCEETAENVTTKKSEAIVEKPLYLRVFFFFFFLYFCPFFSCWESWVSSCFVLIWVNDLKTIGF